MDWLDDRYEVSDAGEVRSWKIRRKTEGRAAAPRELTQFLGKDGYWRVGVISGGRQQTLSVARCVLRAFTGVFGPHANHIDGNRTNNARTNLEWCTASENHLHAHRVLGRAPGGCAQVAVVQLTRDGTVVRVWPSQMAAARAGFHHSSISAVCRGVNRSHGGFLWKHFDEVLKL
jgi:hypothetical protein